MFSPLRNRFGIPGVISVIALVFAMLGGAYAAQSSDDGKATASAKAKRGPKGPKGATGPAGPAGPQGAQGAAGAAGAPGKDGESVKLSNASGAECLEGGTKLTVGATSAKVCNGEEGAPGAPGAPGAQGPAGSPWVAGTAPDGAVLKGTWSAPYYNATGAGERVFVPISTGVPVPSLDGSSADSFTLVAIDPDNPFEEAEIQELAEELCPGSALNPTVNTDLVGASVLCVYVEDSTNLNPPTISVLDAEAWPLAATSGGGFLAGFQSAAAGVAKGYGSWAFEIE